MDTNQEGNKKRQGSNSGQSDRSWAQQPPTHPHPFIGTLIFVLQTLVSLFPGLFYFCLCPHQHFYYLFTPKLLGAKCLRSHDDGIPSQERGLKFHRWTKEEGRKPAQNSWTAVPLYLQQPTRGMPGLRSDLQVNRESAWHLHIQSWSEAINLQVPAWHHAGAIEGEKKEASNSSTLVIHSSVSPTSQSWSQPYLFKRFLPQFNTNLGTHSKDSYPLRKS